MGFGRNRSSLSQVQDGRKTRVRSLLPPKRHGQGYSTSQLQRSCSSEDLSQDSIQHQNHHHQQARGHVGPTHSSQRSYSPRSRGGFNNVHDGPPSGSDPQDEERYQHTALSHQEQGQLRMSQAENGSSGFRLVYHDSIPLGQPSDFSSDSFSSRMKELSQNHQHPYNEVPLSQTSRFGQGVNASRKSSLLDSGRSKLLLGIKKTHFANDSRRSEMPRSHDRPMDFLSQESSTSRTSSGPPRAMNLSQSIRYGPRSSQSSYNSTIGSSQSQSLPIIGSRNRGGSHAQALLTRTIMSKVCSPAPHVAFANNATLRKSQVEKQQYPEIHLEENASGQVRNDPARQEILQKLEEDFIAKLETVMTEKKHEFDRHTQETEQKAIEAVEAKASASISLIGDSAQKAETQLHEEQESIMTAVRCETKNTLNRWREEATKLSTLIENKTQDAVEAIGSAKTKALETMQSLYSTCNKMLPTLSVKKLSMASPSSQAVETSCGKEDEGQCTTEVQVLDNVITPRGPAAAAMGRAKKKKQSKLFSPAVTRSRVRRKKKDKARPIPVETMVHKETSPPIKSIEFKEETEDPPTPSKRVVGNFSTQSLVVSPEQELEMASGPKHSIQSKPPSKVNLKYNTSLTPQSSRRTSSQRVSKSSGEKRKATHTVPTTGDVRPKSTVTSKRAQERQIKTTDQDLRKERIGQEKQVSATTRSISTSMSMGKSSSSIGKNRPTSASKVSSRASKAATPQSVASKSRRRRKRKAAMDDSSHLYPKRAKKATKVSSVEKTTHDAAKAKNKNQGSSESFVADDFIASTDQKQLFADGAENAKPIYNRRRFKSKHTYSKRRSVMELDDTVYKFSSHD